MTLLKPTMKQLRTANAIFFSKESEKYHHTVSYTIKKDALDYSLHTVNKFTGSQGHESFSQSCYAIDPDTLRLTFSRHLCAA